MLNQIRIKSCLLAGIAASSALIATAVSGTPNAKADCASFFGLGNTAQCQSNPTSIAVAFGPNTTAIASGLFSTAVSFGNDFLNVPGTGDATAIATGAFTLAMAGGDTVTAQADGLLSAALQLGYDGTTTTEGVGNVAEAITNPFGSSTNSIVTTLASGIGNAITNAAFSSGPGHSGEAVGVGNYAFNGWGTDNVVQAGGTPLSFFNVAFTVFTNGSVTAGPGPFAVAVAIGEQSGPTTQVGPGFNISTGSTVSNEFAAAGTAKPANATMAKAKNHVTSPTVAKPAVALHINAAASTGSTTQAARHSSRG